VAYPFIYHPTWREVIDRLKNECQITFHTTGKVQSPKGEIAPVQYFEHKTKEGVFRHVVVFTDENERLLPSMIRSLCANLRISPKLFGMELD
jgi:hypothetical protein